MRVPSWLKDLYKYETVTPEELLRLRKVQNARATWFADLQANLALAFFAAYLLSPAISERNISVLEVFNTWIWILVSLALYWIGYWVLNKVQLGD